MTTYALIGTDFTAEAENLTAEEAAREFYGYDGTQYEVRRIDTSDYNRWIVFSTRAGGGLIYTPCYGVGSVVAETAEEAWPLLVQRAIEFTSDRGPSIWEQDAWDRTMTPDATDDEED